MKSKTNQCIKLRNCDIIDDKKTDSSSVLRPKVEIFAEMFRANL